ncbi:MAG: carboxypeptidase regulatory-like domain-containing protein [Lewinellaceae bacterium]|nr:carboxypeptidase regulatory-like domain-containing protein [Lewinellaceae bacterium]
MYPKAISSLICIVLIMMPLLATAQKTSSTKSPPQTAVDSMMMGSSGFVFRQSSISEDTSKATLRVRVVEKGGDAEPIQGATVLLRRDKDKMLGRVTKPDGRCLFVSVPESYTIRVQMTGLKTFEKPGFMLEAGKVYDMEILMAKN